MTRLICKYKTRLNLKEMSYSEKDFILFYFILFYWFFETGFLCIALAVLELTL